MRYGGRIRIGALLAGIAALVGMLAGCGGGKDFADKPRPPAPLQLTGVITSSGVTVSPNKVGAGPVTIIFSNQTQAAQTITLDGASIQPVTTPPISPTDTGTIQSNLRPGVYTVKAGSPHAVTKAIAPARLIIGKPRPDSNNEVGLP